MKYYKNLIKRKKYGILLRCLVVFLLGAVGFYFSFIDTIVRNINWNNSNVTSNFIIVDLLGHTNIGLTILSLFIMFIGLIWMPMNFADAQDDSDYDIKSEGEYLHIFYKKNEFLVKKETFEPTNLFFRDKNKRFVSMTRGYQIYNYVKAKYKKITEKEIDESKVILKSEVVDKFSNVRTMTNEEKFEFLNNQKIKDKLRFPYIILSIFLWFIFAFILLALFGAVITSDYNIQFIITAIIMAIILFISGIKSNKAITKNKRIFNRIMNNDMFLVECQVYDKKIDTSGGADGSVEINHYIKITDGNYIVDQWIKIPKEKYEQNLTNVLFYVFDKTGNEYFIIK